MKLNHAERGLVNVSSDSNVPARPVERVAIADGSPWNGEHRARYRFAQQHVAGKRVLDIAAGTGFGAAMLSEAGASEVVGCDLSPTAMVSASREHGSPPIRFVAADGNLIPFRDASFDVITTFETLEHIADGVGYLKELRRVLRPAGELFLSTPNAAITAEYVRNPYHHREYTAGELTEVLELYFESVEILGQTLCPSFRVAPFLPGWDRAESIMERLQLTSWKITNRLPCSAREFVARRFLGRSSFYPSESDYQFVPLLRRSHVLMATARAP
jgi:SAM-dependent methyltransferase